MFPNVWNDGAGCHEFVILGCKQDVELCSHTPLPTGHHHSSIRHNTNYNASSFRNLKFKYIQTLEDLLLLNTSVHKTSSIFTRNSRYSKRSSWSVDRERCLKVLWTMSKLKPASLFHVHHFRAVSQVEKYAQIPAQRHLTCPLLRLSRIYLPFKAQNHTNSSITNTPLCGLSATRFF